MAFDDAIVAYDIYIEGHEQYAQRFIVRTNSMVKEFRFRNSLGTYDYIYAVGSQSQELETDVSTFINSGHEAELSNTSKMYFKSDSGYLDTAGKSDTGITFWNLTKDMYSSKTEKRQPEMTHGERLSLTKPNPRQRGMN